MTNISPEAMREAERLAKRIEVLAWKIVAGKIANKKVFDVDMAAKLIAIYLDELQAARDEGARQSQLKEKILRDVLKQIAEAWVEVFGKKVPVEYVKSVREIAEKALAEYGDKTPPVAAAPSGLIPAREWVKTDKYLPKSGSFTLEQFISFVEAIQSNALAANAAGKAVPDNWVLVPIELTEDMSDKAAHIADGPDVTYQEHWDAMLAAAPQSPLPTVSEVRRKALEPAKEACVEPFKFGGGAPSSTRKEAWKECQNAIQALIDNGERHE